MNGDDIAPCGSSASRESRISELQDALNRRVYHPLAWQLAGRLRHTAITPNMVSVAGGLLVVGAAIAYTQAPWPYSAMLGLALHMTWHVVDGADGDLARLTGRASPSGEIVDGLSDYLSHIVLYLALGIVLQGQMGPWAWLLVCGAGFSRVLQANFYEVQRRQYQWWVHGIPWLRAAGNETRPRSGVLGVVAAAYLRLASRLSPPAGSVDDSIAAARTDPAQLAAVRAIIRDRYGPSVKKLTWLSANYRTILLGLSMLAGSPFYYFAFEAVVLNLILAGSIKSCEAAIARSVEAIAQFDCRTFR